MPNSFPIKAASLQGRYDPNLPGRKGFNFKKFTTFLQFYADLKSVKETYKDDIQFTKKDQPEDNFVTANEAKAGIKFFEDVVENYILQTSYFKKSKGVLEAEIPDFSPNQAVKDNQLSLQECKDALQIYSFKYPDLSYVEKAAAWVAKRS